MTWLVVYFPVPTMRRELNVRPPISKGASSARASSRAAIESVMSASTHEVHELDRVAFVDRGFLVPVPLEDLPVELDHHHAGLEVEGFQKRAHGLSARHMTRFTVELDLHRLSRIHRPSVDGLSSATR